MAKFHRLKEGKRKYLLLPTMPTPNGGLHLGHLSGPYLKMDVLARAHRRNGSHASLMCGSDVYESYTTLKSWQTNTQVEQVCRVFHEQIKKDLDAIRIEYDAYINPLDEEIREDFHQFFTGILTGLVESGVTEVRSEDYLYSPDEKNYLAGCWITGNCPVCGSGTGSYQCEECGTHYRPMDIGNPQFRKGDYPLKEIKDKALYLTVSKPEVLVHRLHSMGIRQEFIEMVKTYFQHQGPRIRLTNPDTWGTPWNIEGSIVPQVIFTYTALYFFGVYLGRIYAGQNKTPYNAFHPKSDVITVSSFGIDCSIPYMVGGIACGLESGLYKPTDFMLPNHFFRLEESKFSTSRGHAIWGHDIIHKTPATPDSVRYFLIWKNPENEKKNFKITEFIDFVNTELVGDLQPMLAEIWSRITRQPGSDCPKALSDKLEQLLIIQLETLTPPTFELRKCIPPLREWINFGATLTLTPDIAYWWLKGFSLLAFPIIPDCAEGLWRLLGHQRQPLESEFFRLTEVVLNEALPRYFNPLNYELVRPALPATLLANEVNLEN